MHREQYSSAAAPLLCATISMDRTVNTIPLLLFTCLYLAMAVVYMLFSIWREGLEVVCGYTFLRIQPFWIM
jgi:hypothetical protein